MSEAYNIAAQEAEKAEDTRPLDPNVLQRRASNPESCVWVNASAGTGKTKVLTDRVLRLLLPRDSGAPGTQAHKILCLTFTKAGAAEMALRISKTLSNWAVFEETKLHEDLKNLYGRPAKSHEIEAARKLFAQVVDVPGGLKIMTIHAFCQSVLGRFPLEAGINPNFKPLQEQGAAQLLTRAAQTIFERASSRDPQDTLTAAIQKIGTAITEDQFQSLLQNITSERRQFKEIQAIHNKDKNLHAALCDMLEIHPEDTRQKTLFDSLNNAALDHAALKNAAQTMLDIGNKTNQGAGEKILHLLSLTAEARPTYFGEYKSAFLTTKDERLAKLAGKDVIINNPEALEVLTEEAERILKILDHLKRIESARLTADLLNICETILNQYDALKSQQGALDFDDLILKTLDLLNGRSAWVQYKLDQGLDHILIDEAQDTNPEQWQIIKALCDDFFDGENAHETARTTFVVGDEKQSIYSFQRASPEEFAAMREYFAHKVVQSGKAWDEVNLNISFRSTQAVLDTVDSTFAPGYIRQGVSAAAIKHDSYRIGQSGQIELWPLTEAEDPPSQSLWEPPITVYTQENAAQKLSLQIAQTIKHWIDSGEILPSRKRAIRPDDIMILVRTRGALVERISRALKTLGVPVNGADRMILGNQIAVLDLLAAAKFALCPHDDLTLACLLKSPLIGMDEDTLFTLSHNREASLYESCLQSADKKTKTYLRNLISAARSKSPYAFFCGLLQNPCPANDASGRRAFSARLGADAMDPLEEWLRLAIEFEKEESQSLQHFIAAHDPESGKDTTEIKREGEDAGGAIRIMTIHGSKGLQAPIVILPDTISTPKSAPTKADKRLLWPKQTNLPLPLWSPRKNMDPEIFQTALQKLEIRSLEEYRRLLYVAMTRAEDRLIICGAKGKRDPAEDCWYTLMRAGFKTLSPLSESENGNTIYLTQQTREADRIKPDSPQQNLDIHDLPDWIYTPADKEDDSSAILRPSHIDDTAASPLSGLAANRFLRGNLTHKLLQLLPDLPQEIWAEKAASYLAHYGRELPETIRENIAAETLAILKNPQFTKIFGEGSMAEVPITGYHKPTNQPVSGQIDRLLITQDEILIIDFKTNRPPPKTPAQIPQIYRDQLGLYAEILKDIYPGRAIKCALLWTDGAILMPLEL